MDLPLLEAEGVTPGWPPSLPRKTLNLRTWDSAEAMHETQIFSELKLLSVMRVRLLPSLLLALQLNHLPLLLRLSTLSTSPPFPSLSCHRSIRSPTTRTGFEEVYCILGSTIWCDFKSCSMNKGV